MESDKCVELLARSALLPLQGFGPQEPAFADAPVGRIAPAISLRDVRGRAEARAGQPPGALKEARLAQSVVRAESEQCSALRNGRDLPDN